MSQYWDPAPREALPEQTIQQLGQVSTATLTSVLLKFGLRNAPDVYPSGTHLEPTVIALSRERVRRASIGLALLREYYPEAIASELRAKGLAVPVLS